METYNMKQERNARCLCGSGKKYKNCCIDKVPPKKVRDYEELNKDLAEGQENMRAYDASMLSAAKMFLYKKN